MKNSGMIDDYHAARKRSEFGYLAGSGLVAGVFINFIALWPFNGPATWYAQGFLTALAISFYISGRDYERKADQIYRAWIQAARTPG